MKYKLIGGGDLSKPINTILKNREIEADMFYIDENVIEDYNNYDNIQEGVKLLMKHIDNNNKICIIHDSDCDGLTAGAMLANYLTAEFPNVILIHKHHIGKQHGLSDDIVIDADVNLVILPDASSSDYEKHKTLKENNIDVLVIDHHEAEKYSEYAVVVNNQLSKNVKNKNLSGVGVVYKFLKALDDYLYIDRADEYLDLLAIGNIADVINLKEFETRFLVQRGLNSIRNKFLKQLIEDSNYELDGKNLNIKNVGWVLAPKINASVRAASLKEKDDLYRVFMSDDDEFCAKVSKSLKSVKSKQDSSVKSAIKKIEDSLNVDLNDKVIICDSKGASKNYTGLIAGKIASKYKKPCILYSVNNGVASGSGRSVGDINFKEDMLNSNLMIYSQGHSGAMGISLKCENIDKLKDYLNNLYKDIDFEDANIYEVDFELEEYEVDQSLVDEIAELENEWGNGLDEPLLAIKNVELNLTEDNLKGRLNIVWHINDVKCIKKFATNVLKGELINNNVIVDLIAKCTIDNYSGRGQLEIMDIEIN